MKKPLEGFYKIDICKTFILVTVALFVVLVVFTFAFLPEDKVIMEKLRRFYNENPNIDVPSLLGLAMIIVIVIVLLVVLYMVQLKEVKKNEK